MGSRSSRAIFVAASLALLFGAAEARAEPSASDKETARGLMATGRADRSNHDLAGALKAFTGADAIMHVPTTGLEVAKAQIDLGLLVEARDTALRVADAACGTRARALQDGPRFGRRAGRRPGRADSIAHRDAQGVARRVEAGQ